MGAQWKAKGKELAANARGKLFGRLAKDIMVAVRSGADPASNSRLVVEHCTRGVQTLPNMRLPPHGLGRSLGLNLRSLKNFWMHFPESA
jgi:hypothetical protein